MLSGSVTAGRLNRWKGFDTSTSLQDLIPSAGSVLRELESARTPESKTRVWSRSLDPIDSIGWLLSITVRLNLPAHRKRLGLLFWPVAVWTSALFLRS